MMPPCKLKKSQQVMGSALAAGDGLLFYHQNLSVWDKAHLNCTYSCCAALAAGLQSIHHSMTPPTTILRSILSGFHCAYHASAFIPICYMCHFALNTLFPCSAVHLASAEHLITRRPSIAMCL
jgi:hypothetical protein